MILGGASFLVDKIPFHETERMVSYRQERNKEDTRLLNRARRLAKRSRAEAACLPCKMKKAKCGDIRPCVRCRLSNEAGCINSSSMARSAPANGLSVLLGSNQSIESRESSVEFYRAARLPYRPPGPPLLVKAIQQALRYSPTIEVSANPCLRPW